MTKRINILVVDDSEDAQHFVRRAASLVSEHINCIELSDGRDLIEYALSPDNLAPDLVLLDISMQRMGGLEALVKARRTEMFKMTPIIMMSVSNAQADINAAFERGATNYFEKPGTLQDYADCIRLTLEYIE